MWRDVIRDDVCDLTRRAVDTPFVRATIVDLVKIIGASAVDDGDVFHLWDVAGRALMALPGNDVAVIQALSGLPKVKEAASQSLLGRLSHSWRLGNAYSDGLRVWGAYVKQFTQRIEPSWRDSQTRLDSMGDDELQAYCMALMVEYGQVCALRLRLAFMGTLAVYGLIGRIQQLNRRTARERGIDWLDLISGLGTLPIVQPVLDLWSLARAALTHQDVTDVIVQSDIEAIPARLQATAVGAIFWGRVARFLSTYRHWGGVMDDWASPRWDEDATAVLLALRQYVQADAAFDPILRTRAQHKNREESTALVKQVVWGGVRRLWPVPGVIVLAVLERAQLYVRSIVAAWDVSARVGYYARQAYLEQARRTGNEALFDSRVTSKTSYSQGNVIDSEDALVHVDKLILGLPLLRDVPFTGQGRLGLLAVAAGELGAMQR